VGFVQRLIQVSVTLAQNTQTNQPTNFAESGTPQVNLTGSRVSVKIENSGATVGSKAQVKIWGMTPSLMNQLSTLGQIFNLVGRNNLTIQAGDAIAGLSTVFTGTIQAAYGDYSNQPDVPFVFQCQSGLADQVIGTPASSFPGSQSVANMMAGFARQMNLGFENNGVSITLTNAYFSGPAKVQADKCARAAGITWGYTNGGAAMAIWPLGGSRNTPNIPIISPDTGMISYPAFTPNGIVVKTLFNPQISFGALVQVKSSLLSAIASVQPTQPTAGGGSRPTFPTQWAVNKLDLDLDSLVPKGNWMMTIFAYNPGWSKTILPPSS
jgi:baseplate hub protein gp41